MGRAPQPAPWHTLPPPHRHLRTPPAAAQALRELWVQANPLDSTAGLEGLRSLQVLSLAGTSIDSLAHLEALRPITTLFDLAFDDGPYGAAPIARADGYAASVIHLLPQLGVLDGRAVSVHERSDADEEVLRRSLRLSHWVEACKA